MTGSPSLSPEQKKAHGAATTRARLREYHSVYQHSADGKAYIKPWELRNVPVGCVTEERDVPSWPKKWVTFRSLLDQADTIDATIPKLESLPAIQKVERRKELVDLKKLANKLKMIKTFFNPDKRNHPNQLLRPFYMPNEGLCAHLDTLYLIACKLTDLQALKDTGQLEMEPFHFFRWRLCCKVQSKKGDKWQRSLPSLIKSLVDTRNKKLTDDETYLGPIIIHGADTQDRSNTTTLEDALTNTAAIIRDAPLETPRSGPKQKRAKTIKEKRVSAHKTPHALLTTEERQYTTGAAVASVLGETSADPERGQISQLPGSRGRPNSTSTAAGLASKRKSTDMNTLRRNEAQTRKPLTETHGQETARLGKSGLSTYKMRTPMIDGRV